MSNKYKITLQIAKTVPTEQDSKCYVDNYPTKYAHFTPFHIAQINSLRICTFLVL